MASSFLWFRICFGLLFCCAVSLSNGFCCHCLPPTSTPPTSHLGLSSTPWVTDARPTEGEKEIWNQVNAVLQDSENILSGLQAYKGAGQEIREVCQA